MSLQRTSLNKCPKSDPRQANEYILIKSYFTQDKMEEFFAHSKNLRAAKADNRTERELPQGYKGHGDVWTKCAFCCRLGRVVSLDYLVRRNKTYSVTVHLC